MPHPMLSALCSLVLVDHASGFNPLPAVPMHRVPNAQPQTAPNRAVIPRTRHFPVPVPFPSPSGAAFLPPIPPSDPALSATATLQGLRDEVTVPTAAREAVEGAPMTAQEANELMWEAPRTADEERGRSQNTKADGGSWFVFAAGVLAGFSAAFGLLLSRRSRIWQQYRTSSPFLPLQERVEMGANSLRLQGMIGTTGGEPVSTASPALRASFRAPLVANFSSMGAPGQSSVFHPASGGAGKGATPAAGLQSASAPSQANASNTSLQMQRGSGDGANVSRKAAMQLMGLALAGVSAAPKDAGAFAENFFVPGVSDGAGGSISKEKTAAKTVEKPLPAQIAAATDKLAEGEEIVETEWGPYTKRSREAAKLKGTGNLKCKASVGGGQTCQGSQELEFTKAYDTKDGARTKVTGNKNKVSTYYSQINAGYLTLVELADRWDEYMAAGDGDVVRRRLGTVGSKSPLHNVRKAFEGALTATGKLPPDAVDEETLDWLDENSTNILNLIAEVDSNLYSTAFVGTDETADVLRAQGKTALDKALIKYNAFDKIIGKLSN